MRHQLLEAIEELPVREREIVRLYYIESRSLKSIGQTMSISESRASQLSTGPSAAANRPGQRTAQGCLN